MDATIVNARPKYAPKALPDPPPPGYLHLSVAIDLPANRPLPGRSDRRETLLRELKSLAADLTRHDAVTRATVYRGIMVPPPTPDARRMADHPARYDVVVLVETPTVADLDTVRATPAYQRLADTLTGTARDSHVMAARCVRCVADVDKSRQGLYLFNYFAAADADVATTVWEHLASWYRAETGLANSTLLAPIGPGDYPLVNYASWDKSLPRFAMEQFSKPSFRSYVLANMRANRMAAMPALYRIA